MSNSNKQSDIISGLPRTEQYDEFYILRDFDLRPEKVKDYPCRLNVDLIKELLDLGLLFRTKKEALSAWAAMIEFNSGVRLTPKEWRRALKCIPDKHWDTFLAMNIQKKRNVLDQWWNRHVYKITIYWIAVLLSSSIIYIIINYLYH